MSEHNVVVYFLWVAVGAQHSRRVFVTGVEAKGVGVIKDIMPFATAHDAHIVDDLTRICTRATGCDGDTQRKIDKNVTGPPVVGRRVNGDADHFVLNFEGG